MERNGGAFSLARAAVRIRWPVLARESVCVSFLFFLFFGTLKHREEQGSRVEVDVQRQDINGLARCLGCCSR